MKNCLLVATLLSIAACVTPTKKIEASSTLEDLPNEPVDAGAPEAVAANPKEDAPPPTPVVTFVKAEVPEGFSVMMPKEPQVQRNSVPIKAGNVSTVAMSSNVDGVIYSVTRAEYPESIVKKAGAKKMLGEVRSGLATQLKGTVSDEADAELSGHPGQTFNVAGASNMVRARSAIVANQLYTLVVVYTGKLPEKAEEFLTSLELKSPPPPPAPKK